MRQHRDLPSGSPEASVSVRFPIEAEGHADAERDRDGDPLDENVGDHLLSKPDAFVGDPTDFGELHQGCSRRAFPRQAAWVWRSVA